MLTKIKVLINLLKDQEGVLQGKVYDIIKEEIIISNFIELFTPWQILQAIYETGSGSLNYTGVDTLRDAIKQFFLITQLRNKKKLK